MHFIFESKSSHLNGFSDLLKSVRNHQAKKMQVDVAFKLHKDLLESYLNSYNKILSIKEKSLAINTNLISFCLIIMEFIYGLKSQMMYYP